ncbi:MAG: hypothetical protein N2376_06825 [Clostridia bacterium]|nr:hypothetical protein [Clostridia bacterium]
MKITDLSIIFILIILPFCFLLEIKTANAEIAIYKRVEIHTILDTAVEDGSSTLVEYGSSKNVVINKERAVKAFLTSLYINFGVSADPIGQKMLQGYLPCIIVIDYDGYYVLSNEAYRNASGQTETKLVWSTKRPFVYNSPNYSFSFTLDEQVTVYTLSNGFISGTRDQLAGKIVSNVISDEALFEQIRRRTIVEALKKDINYAINKHNDIARRFGISYYFTLPTIENEDWYKTIDDVGLLVFFQGMPIGITNERINNFSLGGARVVKLSKYFGQEDPLTHIKYYHKQGCPQLLSQDTAFDSRANSAKNGYFPCRICNP